MPPVLHNLAAITLAADPAASGPAFQPFTLMHAIVVVGHGTLMAALVLLGLRCRGKPEGVLVERLWLWFVVAVQAFNLVFWATPPRLEPSSSLPLHICDLAGLVAIACMAVPVTSWSSRLWRTIMFYWGIGLSTQAFVTPVIQDGPETVRFHIFFLSHLTIVGTALYDFIVREYRPRWRDLGVIALVSATYGAMVLPLNIAMGWNYGYTGDTRPDNPTIIDALGPWPLRLLWLGLIVHAVYLVLTLGGSRVPRAAPRAAQPR